MPSVLILLAFAAFVLGCGGDGMAPWAPKLNEDAGMDARTEDNGPPNRNDGGGLRPTDAGGRTDGAPLDGDVGDGGVDPVNGRFYRIGKIVATQGDGFCDATAIQPFGTDVAHGAFMLCNDTRQVFRPSNLAHRRMVVHPSTGDIIYLRRPYVTDPARFGIVDATGPAVLAKFLADPIHRILENERAHYELQPDYLDNDEVIATECEPNEFWTYPDADNIAYRCTDGSYRALSGDGPSVPAGYDIVAIGYADHALLYGADEASDDDDGGTPAEPTYAILKPDGSVSEIAGTQEFRSPFTSQRGNDTTAEEYLVGVRAVPDGFLLARGNQLWTLSFDASAEVKGSYRYSLFDSLHSDHIFSISVESSHCEMARCTGNMHDCFLLADGDLVCSGRRNDLSAWFMLRIPVDDLATQLVWETDSFAASIAIHRSTDADFIFGAQ